MPETPAPRRVALSAALSFAVAAVVVVAVILALSSRTSESQQRGGADSAASGQQAGQRSQAQRAGPRMIGLPLGLQPEGITSDGRRTFYVGSLADGRVVTGSLRTGDSRVLVPGVPGRVAVGTLFDRRDDRLWVAGGPTGAVTVYDAGTGQELGRWVTPGSVFLNDLTLTRDAVYVTDSGLARLVVIPLGPRGQLPAADAATTLRLTGDMVVDPNDFNANGIRTLNHNTLVLVQSSTGTLFLVDPDTGRTAAVKVTKGRLAGGDGLELGDGRLFVVRGTDDNSVTVLRLGRNGATAQVEQVLRDPDFDVPTTATFADGHLWVVNARFDTEPTATTEYQVVRVDPR